MFGLFEKAMLFDITFMVVIFWMLMGYTASFIAEYEWQEIAVDNRSAIPVGSHYRPEYTYILPAHQQDMVHRFSDLTADRSPDVIGYKRFYYRQGLSPPAVRKIKGNQNDMGAEISL